MSKNSYEQFSQRDSDLIEKNANEIYTNQVLYPTEERYDPYFETEDVQSKIERIQFAALETIHSGNNSPFLPVLSACAYSHAGKIWRNENREDFFLLYKSIFKVFINQLQLLNPEWYSNYIQEWVTNYLSDIVDIPIKISSKLPEISFPSSNTSLSTFIPIKDPNRVSEMSDDDQNQWISDPQDIIINYEDPENAFASGAICFPLIINNNGIITEEYIAYSIFLDDRALYERDKNNALSSEPLINNRVHSLDTMHPDIKYKRRWNIITAVRSSGLPICTRDRLFTRLEFENMLGSYTKIVEVPGFFARERRKQFLLMFPPEIRNSLIAFYALPYKVPGGFESQSVGDHTDRVQTFYQADKSREITIVSQIIQEITIDLHDLVKGYATEFNQHALQHRLTIPLMEKYLNFLLKEKRVDGLDERIKGMMLQMVDQDMIGKYATHWKLEVDPLPIAVNKFQEMMENLQLNQAEAYQYFAWMEKFYFADASSYRNIACTVDQKIFNRKIRLIRFPGSLSLDDAFVKTSDDILQFSNLTASNSLKRIYGEKYTYYLHYEKLRLAIYQYIQDMK